jgi:hypothetical protein
MSSRPSLRSFAVLLAALAAACGGGNNTAAPTGDPTPTPAPTTTPRPSPTPVPNPTLDLAPGPVVRYTIKVHSIDVNGGGGQDFREPGQDGQGRWVLYVGEFVQFDSTQKNAANQICQTQGLPVWNLGGVNGTIRRRDGLPNPFVMRVDVVATGEGSVSSQVDGVQSNTLPLIVKPRR